ncbi:MAG: ankyrin repeat domain-containing protein, partial [Coxiellaceae bacterium]|nr:ankyrin repeat domain-containing protein [Coxiellaceae bacterium]
MQDDTFEFQQSIHDALIAAAIDGDRQRVVELVTELGADIHYVDAKGQSVKSIAQTFDNDELLAVVTSLDRASPQKTSQDKMIEEALFAAIEANDVATLYALLDSGIALTLTDAFGRTPLSAAILAQHRSMILLLLSLGANPNQEHRGYPLVQWAVKQGWHEVFHALLNDKNLDIDQTNPMGQTLAIYLATENHVDALCVLFEAYPKTIFIPDLFHKSITFGAFDVVKLMVKRGVDVNRFNDRQLTPLMSALRAGRFEIAAYLYFQCHANTSRVYAAIDDYPSDDKYAWALENLSVQPMGKVLQIPKFRAAVAARQLLVKYKVKDNIAKLVMLRALASADRKTYEKHLVNAMLQQMKVVPKHEIYTMDDC